MSLAGACSFCGSVSLCQHSSETSSLYCQSLCTEGSGTAHSLCADADWKDPFLASPLILCPVCSWLALLHAVIGEKVAFSPLSLGVKAFLGEEGASVRTLAQQAMDEPQLRGTDGRPHDLVFVWQDGNLYLSKVNGE
jgi:hypothetical protein